MNMSSKVLHEIIVVLSDEQRKEINSRGLVNIVENKTIDDCKPTTYTVTVKETFNGKD